MEHAKNLDEYGADPELSGGWDDESFDEEGGLDPFDTDEEYEGFEDEEEDDEDLDDISGELGRRRQDD